MCHHCTGCEANSDLSRREFLVASAGAAFAGAFLLRGASAQEAAQPARTERQEDWPDVVVAYLRPQEKYWLGWPGASWEANCYEDFVKKSRATLEQFGRDLKVRISFEPEPLYDAAAAEAFAARVKAEKPKGVVLIPLHLKQWSNVKLIAESGVPTVIFAGLGVCFTQHVLKLSRQAGVHLISSADWELTPVRYGLKMIRTAHDIRRTRIAVLAGNDRKDEVLDPLGLQIRRLPRQSFADALNSIGETPDVLAMVDDYQKAAQKTVEPSRQDLLNAARNYFAALKILEAEDCDGITMDCLGAVFDHQIPCPPCMAWSRFLDDGVPAICEADINAVMSHTLCCKLLDKPGFMQDPVPETVHNTFIGAHCVCPTRLNGYDQAREPFILRSHSESNVGVSLQVLWQIGQPVTVMQFTAPDKMILGKGKVLRNFETPPAGGCRTSVELALDGPEDVCDTKGFHQLFIYGDHVRDLQAYGQMHGIMTEHI